MASTLRSNGVKFMTQSAVLAAAKSGSIPVVDVRPEGEYARGHIPGSMNIPLYQLISGWSPRQLFRRVGFAFFGILNGTEKNPDFEAQVRSVIGNGSKGVILVCAQGGTLEETAASKDGRQSRSLISAFELTRLGIKKISVLEGGMSSWRRNEDLPMDTLE